MQKKTSEKKNANDKNDLMVTDFSKKNKNKKIKFQMIPAGSRNKRELKINYTVNYFDNENFITSERLIFKVRLLKWTSERIIIKRKE